MNSCYINSSSKVTPGHAHHKVQGLGRILRQWLRITQIIHKDCDHVLHLTAIKG